MTASEEPPDDACPPAIIIDEVQLILAEKRTSLSSLRTGIAVFAIPLSVMGMLVATSRYYEIADVIPLFIAVMVINVLLLTLGAFLVARAIIKLRNEDRMIRDLKRKHSVIAEFID
ncbi:MAG: hypothetical protein MUD16_10740 [Desulfobacterales bacterium]|jgi:uncharacterized membrane protein YidH (DUF202 family)|nr:hypothetical protein [Desulfobacterales bacterium]